MSKPQEDFSIGIAPSTKIGINTVSKQCQTFNDRLETSLTFIEYSFSVHGALTQWNSNLLFANQRKSSGLFSHFLQYKPFSIKKGGERRKRNQNYFFGI